MSVRPRRYRMWCAYADEKLLDARTWTEDFHRRCGDPAVDAREVIDRFNATLREGERARSLVRVSEGVGDARLDRDWGKTSPVTEVGRGRGGGSFDRMRRRDRGRTGKRHGTGGDVTPDGPRSGWSKECPGDGLTHRVRRWAHGEEFSVSVRWSGRREGEVTREVGALAPVKGPLAYVEVEGVGRVEGPTSSLIRE